MDVDAMVGLVVDGVVGLVVDVEESMMMTDVELVVKVERAMDEVSLVAEFFDRIREKYRWWIGCKRCIRVTSRGGKSCI